MKSRTSLFLVAAIVTTTLIVGFYRKGIVERSLPPKEISVAQSNIKAPLNSPSAVLPAQTDPKIFVRLENNQAASNWDHEFYRAHNLYPLVKRAALAAINEKDGRAAYLVSQSLSACAAVSRSAQQDPNFEAKFDDDYSKMAPMAPQWARVKARQEFDRCVQMAKEDPFDGLPLRSEGYRHSAFWQDMALANNDPLAEAHQAYLDMADANYQDALSRGPVIQEAQRLISEAAKSGDPAAVFLTGQVLANGRNSADPLRGVAISLAACDLGYDCSAKNPANSFAVCKESGACPADADYAYYMQQSLGSEDYATAYNKSRVFMDLIARGDWSGVGKFVTLDGALVSKN